MLPRGLVPLGLALAVQLAPEPARACSCARFDTPTVERCRTAERVFAGTVEAVEFPWLFELDGATTSRLRVDTVWRGQPPAALLAYTAPPCGGWVTAPPGSPFLICDDDADGTWTSFGMCRQPRFDAAPEIRATLGPGRPPTAPPVLAWQPWRSEEFLWSLAAILALPLIGVGLGALIGRLRGRIAGTARSPIRRLFILTGTILVLRLLLREVPVADQQLWDRWLTQYAAIVALATLVGLWLAHRGQRRGGPTGLPLLGAGLTLVAGFVRLHVPLQPADAVACSEARAREFLRTAPIDLDFRDDERADHERWRASPATAAVRAEHLRLAAEAVPNACSEWGLRRMRFDPDAHDGPCVEFDDALGGTYRLCARREPTEYHVERPG